MISPCKHVLLIEDNADNRYLATVLLEQEGYHVTAVVNGRDGIDATSHERFAFVVLDLQLPDIDGLEVARQIRERFPATDLPIVAVSAFTLAAERRRALAAGCRGYLEKPIEAETFVTQLRALAGIPTQA